MITRIFLQSKEKIVEIIFMAQPSLFFPYFDFAAAEKVDTGR